jgi:6,7-dimethyl-8-ribityllumazine synthase
MLTQVRQSKARKSQGTFAIVASTYNARFVDAMVASAHQEFKKAGVKTVRLIRVPGAFPVVAARLAAVTPGWSGIVCLGVILRGQTDHAQQIANAVTASLSQLQIQRGIPIIHEVLLLENEEQAAVRCLGKKHNRGAEAAQTALEMERVMASISTGP